MRVWQVAAGDGTRDYADVFLRFGVILVGPGSEGDYFSNRNAYDNPDSWTYQSFIRRIAEELEVGDLVVLKRPSGQKWRVVAVGEVISCYSWEGVFEDVDGWDLQHCRHVSWREPLSETVISGLRRGTFLRVASSKTVDRVSEVWASGRPVGSTPFPQEAEEVRVDELIDFLMIQGAPSQIAELTANTIWRLRRVAKWYTSHARAVGEHEIRTFLIIPLLMSLGWAEQQIKIEWRKVDIALFGQPYSQESSPLAIIESKRLGDGLLFAPGQAVNYLQSYPDCDRFIVSDGIRYKLYRREGNCWAYAA